MENDFIIDTIKKSFDDVKDKLALKKNNDVNKSKLDLLKLLKNNVFKMDLQQLNYGLNLCKNGNKTQVNKLIQKINNNHNRVIKLNKRIKKIKDIDYDAEFNRINKKGEYNVSSTLTIYKKFDDDRVIMAKPYYIRNVGKFEFIRKFNITTNKNIFEFDGKRTFKEDKKKFVRLLKILSVSDDSVRTLISYLINYIDLIEVFDSHELENVIP